MKKDSHPLTAAEEKPKETRVSQWSYTAIDVRDLEILPVQPWHPAVDVYEIEDELIFIMELAGVDPNQIQVSRHGNYLVITGTRKSPIPAGVTKVHRIEIGHGPFERRFRLPSPVQSHVVETRLVGGYFVVTLLKRRV